MIEGKRKSSKTQCRINIITEGIESQCRSNLSLWSLYYDKEFYKIRTKTGQACGLG